MSNSAQRLNGKVIRRDSQRGTIRGRDGEKYVFEDSDLAANVTWSQVREKTVVSFLECPKTGFDQFKRATDVDPD